MGPQGVDVSKVSNNNFAWKQGAWERATPAWARDLGKVDANGCLVAVTQWCSKPASLKDVVTFTVVVGGATVVIILAAPVVIEGGMTVAAIYVATGATGAAGLVAPSLNKVGEIIVEGEGGAGLPRPASPSELVGMMNRRPGVTAEISDSPDLIRLLDSRKAQGLTFMEQGGFSVFLRAGSSRSDVLHEWLHVVRSGQGIGMGVGEEDLIDGWLASHSELLRLGHGD